MSRTKQQHRDAAATLMSQYPKLRRGHALNAVASLYGVNWHTLGARPGLPRLPRTEAAAALGVFLQGCDEGVSKAQSVFLVDLLAPERAAITLAVDADYVFVVQDNCVSSGFYSDTLELNVLARVLGELLPDREIRTADVYSLIRARHLSTCPEDQQFDRLDNEKEVLTNALHDDPSLLSQLSVLYDLS